MDSGSHALAEPGAAVPGAVPLAARLAEFTEKSEALGVRVARVGSTVEAGGLIAAWADELGVDQIVVARDVRDCVPGLSESLSESSSRIIEPVGPASVRDAPLGVSLARLAVAETGSVLLVEPSLPDRAVSMLTLALAVICPVDALVAGLDEAAVELRRIALEPGASFATLVTGPSRTADIERVLTVGVQGPGVVAVIFVDELAVGR